MSDNDELTPKQKRSLHKMILQFIRSTVLFWVPALIFFVLANSVRTNDPLAGEVTILTTIHSVTTTWLTQFFIVVTSLGSAPFVVAGVAIAAATMWYIGQRKNAIFLLFSAGGTAAINVIFKLLFARDRPDLWHHLVVEEGFSFPSGHAMISSALALAVIILTWHTKYRWFAVIIGLIYTFLVGISRLYLGVHFPSDIIAGWCVSVLWILTLHHALTRYTKRRNLEYSSDKNALK
jgi:undecaprenyl-diphosphatase